MPSGYDTKYVIRKKVGLSFYVRAVGTGLAGPALAGPLFG